MKCSSLVAISIGVLLSVLSHALQLNQLEMQGNCQKFQVELPANPTTGYQWMLENYDKATFNFINDDYISSADNRMGAPGKHVFYFEKKIEMVCPDTTTLCFSFSRAWDKNSSTCTNIKVQFKSD